MSDSTQEPTVIHVSKPAVKRSGCLMVGIGLIVAFLLLSSLSRPYVDWLWFKHDARHPEVFQVAYATRGLLFSIAFVLATGLFALTFMRALQVGQVFSRVPQSITEIALVRALDWIQKNAVGAAKLASLVLGLFFAVGFSREWSTFLLFKNGEPFGVQDPTFGRDIGYFVFELPWYTALWQSVASLLTLASLSTIGIYIGLGTLAKAAKIELDNRRIQTHLSLLLGATFIAFGILGWVKRYEYGMMDSPQFTGAGYAAMQKLAVQGWVSVLAIVAGVASLAGFRSKTPYAAPILGTLALGLLYVGGMVAWPLIIQRFAVEPNKLDLEKPYATRAIEMTRWAYALDQIEVRKVDVAETPAAEDLGAASGTLASMRLWDPEILRRNIEVQQGLRPYYAFADVDVDRYMIDGKPTPVMLSPRDIRREGLTASARTWVNTTLQYTHGYGVVMAAVNSSTSQGQPVYLIKDFPPKTPKDIPLEEPRIYFSDLRDSYGNPSDEYVLVDTKVEEFDYPGDEGDRTNRWTGGRGIPVSGLARTALGLVLGDGNLLVSPNVSGDTRVLLHRSVIGRCRMLFPFLKFDNDPYIVLLGSRVHWVIDAYTTSDRVPYSEYTAQPGSNRVNYMRNSVKVTVDGYSGETIAYAMQPDEPVLKAYRKIYPKLIADASAMPEGLREHLRYPEDLFSAQASTLTQYHVTDPINFLNNSDAWEKPIETNPDGIQVQMQPYYVQMRLPGESKDGYMLILPFTPRQKPNMSGWLAAHCDPADYGKMILYQYPKGSNLPGPAQMEAKINQDPEMANLNKLWNNEQSTLVGGNLLVIPIGKSVLYIRPLFQQSRTNRIPEMRRVVLALSDRVVLAESYEQGLAILFGKGEVPSGAKPVPAAAPDKPATSGGAVDLSGVREAALLLDQADAALRAGDFAKYGELQKRARALLERLMGK